MTIELKAHDEQLVKIFKALADPTRIEIIRTLQGSKIEMNCGEVGEKCEASKSNASYHFRTLREAGLIRVRKDAQTKWITIDDETFSRYLPGFLETLNN
ncbi:metalloregulator ArsR/SmtB family transcription factor [Paenibacillus filicis]|uniref:Metalloregulator ArsR/SmtB family transcription factor n=1 Tax=Paenibacillus gyeongsangnamensis TaxID=3388067 RepID=A0ABT4QAY4_9BACL|nr:metalloregulator ArsR/SmtB family transcription factor [Paenibacillus filicis]MCZ8514053.1 metalloregulator ArsR/SmtB family transcription factor [Paenibacillus filicis]